MNEILDHLFQKFADKGLTPYEIIRVVKDASNAFEEEENVNASVINNRLRSLGWQDQLVDEHILNLLIFLFENGNEKGLKWMFRRTN